MIFMNPSERNSLAIGPKIRVPMGSPLFASKTAAFSSNLTQVSSGRLIDLAVRTTTAFSTSPFFTFACGMASLTVTTIISPILA